MRRRRHRVRRWRRRRRRRSRLWRRGWRWRRRRRGRFRRRRRRRCSRLGRWRRRRCCGLGRSRDGRRRARRRLRRCLLLGLSVGTKFFLGLGHDQRRGLRVRWRSNQLHRRKSGRGKQQEAKVCHDGWDPRGNLGDKVRRSTNKQAGLWRPSTADLYLFVNRQGPGAPLFITHSGAGLKP
jgi:hypothetical protein